MKDQTAPAELNKKEDQKLLLPEMVKSEVNFLILPFFALSRRGLKNKTKIIYRDVIKRGDQRLEILWKVSANPEYGYPGPFDREVHKAIEQIISEILYKKGSITNPVPLGSFSSICRRMGINKYGGSEYKQIKEAFRRVRHTGIESIGAFYSKKQEEWIEDNFGVYERVVFKGRKLPNGEIADTNYLFLGSWYLQSLNAFYIKPLDYRYLKSLESKIASRLYEILGVRFYGLQRREQPYVWFDYHTLCQLLPITPQRYYSKAKEKLKSAHDELIKTLFLAKVRWEKKSKTEWLIYYYPGRRAREELEKTAPKEPLDPKELSQYLPPPKSPSEGKIEPLEGKSEEGSGSDLVAELVKRRISEKVASELARRYQARIAEKVEIFDWIKAEKPDEVKRPAAYLRRMIEEDWPAPEGFVSKAEREAKRKAIEKEYQKRVAGAKAEAEKWAARPAEERVAGQLQFWMTGQKLKGHQPTEEQIQAKKDELIQSLHTKEKYLEDLIQDIERDLQIRQ